MATTTTTAAKPAATKTAAVIEAVGKAACKKYGLAKVYVTSDGVVFKQSNDARNHAVKLENKDVTTVER